MISTFPAYRLLVWTVCAALVWGVAGPVVHHACASTHNHAAEAESVTTHGPTAAKAERPAPPECEEHATAPGPAGHDTAEHDTAEHAPERPAPERTASPAHCMCPSEGPSSTCGDAGACCTVRSAPERAHDGIRASLLPAPTLAVVLAVASVLHEPADRLPPLAAFHDAASPPPVRLHVWTNTFLN